MHQYILMISTLWISLPCITLDEFRFTFFRSNPGFASLSCAVDVLIDGETLSPNNVTLSVGQTLSSSRPIPYSSTRLDGEFRNNSFIVGNMNDDDEVFCYVGQLPSQARSFSLASISPVFDFYDLPVLTSGPVVTSISASSVTVSWNCWTPSLDSGDGPVIGYFIYRQMMGEEWEQVSGVREVDLTKDRAELQRRMEFILTGLEPDTEYNISVSSFREDEGGEGPRSPHVTATTSNLDNDNVKEASRVWIFIFWISLAGNVIFAVALVIVWKRREKDLPRSSASPPTSDAESPDHYEIPQASAVENHNYQDIRV